MAARRRWRFPGFRVGIEHDGMAGETALDREFEGVDTIAWRMRIVLPTHPWRLTWDWVLILLVLYTAISVPIEVCFTYKTHLGVMIIDRFVDVFFISDIVLNFRTAIYNRDGTFEIEPKMIARMYVRSWFLIDLIASIPYDLFTGNGSGAAALALAKLPRLLRFFRLVKKLEMLTAARVMRFLSVLIIFILFTHVVACFWWLVGVSMGPYGWQFQDEVVPLLLQEVDWEYTPRHLAQSPMLALDEWQPTWLPTMYNHSQLLELYEDPDRVGLARSYITSMYWALTMVMKSPWLPPQSLGEQVFACSIVVLGAMFFAWFLGHVTTTIQSYDKSNALYRDQMSTLHNFFTARPLPARIRSTILRYTDAYFKTTVDGVQLHSILHQLPEHLRPSVVMEVHADLLAACPFLQEASYSGVADFLIALRPEVCLKGDSLVRAGTTCDLFFILMHGELQVSFPPEGSKTKKLAALFGTTAVSTTSSGHKQSQRIPQGRIERRGTLIGWQPPFDPIAPSRYTARAYRFSSLMSIRREALCAVLVKHPSDAPLFVKAVDHAEKTLRPAKKGSHKNASCDEGGSYHKHSVADVNAAREGELGEASRVSISAPARPSSAGMRNSTAGGKTGSSATPAADELAEISQAGWLPKAAPAGSARAVQQAPAPSWDDYGGEGATGGGGDGDDNGETRTPWSELRAWMAEREAEEGRTRALLLSEMQKGFEQLATRLGTEARAQSPGEDKVRA